MRFLSLLLLIIATITSHSAFSDGYFKWRDKHGNIQYGDKPPKNIHLEKLQMPQLTIIENYAEQWKSPESNTNAPKQNKTASAKTTAPSTPVAEEERYERFAFIAPKPDQVIRAKDGDVSAMLSIRPPLKKKHKIAFKLDDKTLPESRTRIANFTNLTIGYHTLSAEIIGTNKQTLQTTKKITFRVIRYQAKRSVKK